MNFVPGVEIHVGVGLRPRSMEGWESGPGIRVM